MIRKLGLLLIGAMSLTGPDVFAQAPQNNNPFIQVTGISEKDAVPDEFYISIILTESDTGSPKITIEQQEQRLKDSLLNINIKLFDMSWLNKDMLHRKDYILKVTTPGMVGKVFHMLKNMGIKNPFIAKTDYSGKEELQKGIRKDAMKNGKEKAQYMLESIGEKPGKLLSVTESAINVISDGFDDPGNVVYDINIPDEYIGFKKLKYTSNVIMRFGIK